MKAYLEGKGIPYKDYGCLDESPCDYPVYAKAVAKAIVDGECDKGILICGTGIGISIAANKVKGIRAAVCHDTFSAQATREHNVDTFLNTEFSGEERHVNRIRQIED